MGTASVMLIFSLQVIFPYLVNESADSQNDVSCRQEVEGSKEVEEEGMREVEGSKEVEEEGMKEVEGSQEVEKEGIKEVVEGSKEQEKVEIMEKDVEGIVVATPRRSRSRRMSGVQPDPSLTQVS